MKENGLSVYDNQKKLIVHANLSENRTFCVAMST